MYLKEKRSAGCRSCEQCKNWLKPISLHLCCYWLLSQTFCLRNRCCVYLYSRGIIPQSPGFSGVVHDHPLLERKQTWVCANLGGWIRPL